MLMSGNDAPAVWQKHCTIWLLASLLWLGSARLTARSSRLTTASWATRRCTFLWILQVFIHALCLWPGTERAIRFSLCLFNCVCGFLPFPDLNWNSMLTWPYFVDSIKGPLGFICFASWVMHLAQWILKRVVNAVDLSFNLLWLTNFRNSISWIKFIWR